jgi:signal transduction histidine kinase
MSVPDDSVVWPIATPGAAVKEWLARWFEPTVEHSSAGTRRQARLLLGIAVAHGLCAAASTVATAMDPDPKFAGVMTIALGVATIVSVLVFLLARAGRVQAGTLVLVATNLGVNMAQELGTLQTMRAENLPGVWAVITIALASTLLSVRWTIAVTASVVALVLGVSTVAPVGVRTALAYAALFNAIIGATLAVLARHRDRLEADRAAALQERNAELEALRATLEQRVAERTADLERNQQRLVLTEKMASLGRLTAGIAHEMNSPLGAVRSSLRSLDDLVTEYTHSIGDAEVNDEDHRVIASEMRDLVRLADAGAERAAGFVRGMRAQTRSDEDEPAAFDVVLATRDALRLLGHAAVAKGVKVILDAPGAAVDLLGRAGRYAQVVTNLVQNAIDASDERSGEIHVGVMAVDDELRLVVADHGHGIAPDVRDRIFDPLFTTRPVGQGTGLGLTIVHDIVHGELGGTIDVATEVGRGTRFTVHMPRRAIEQRLDLAS